MKGRGSYDAVADAYAARYLHELDAKPLDRALLRALADDVRAAQAVAPAPVADVGCGPGQVARFVHDLGVEACGVDISPRMCTLARSLHPGISFLEGSMFALPVDSGGWAGVTAFYAICHVPPAQLAAVFWRREFYWAWRC